MSESTMLVRLKTYAPKQGYVMQRYLAFGIRIEAGRGWYEVPEHVARYLAAFHEIPDSPESPLAFDVCTSEQAEAMEEAERRAKEERIASASAPRVTPMVTHRTHVVPPPSRTSTSGDLTTGDLPPVAPPDQPDPEPSPPTAPVPVRRIVHRRPTGA